MLEGTNKPGDMLANEEAIGQRITVHSADA